MSRVCVKDTRRDEEERCFVEYLSFFHDEKIGNVSCRALLRENVCSAMVYAGKKCRLQLFAFVFS